MVTFLAQPACEISLVMGMVEQGSRVSLRWMPAGSRAPGSHPAPAASPSSPALAQAKPPPPSARGWAPGTVLLAADGTPRAKSQGAVLRAWRWVLTRLAAAIGHEFDGALQERGVSAALTPGAPTPLQVAQTRVSRRAAVIGGRGMGLTGRQVLGSKSGQVMLETDEMSWLWILTQLKKVQLLVGSFFMSPGCGQRWC